MKQKYQLSLMIVNILLLVCTSLYAEEQCKDYPDQFPYNEMKCQDVEPLAWVNFPQASVLPNSETLVSISGGQAPFKWSVSGNGFYLEKDSEGNGTKTELISASSNATIYAINACGAATVTVTDGCNSSISGTVRSTGGSWELVPESLWPPPPGFTYYDRAYYVKRRGLVVEVVDGGYKYTQVFSNRNWGGRATGSSSVSYAKAEENLYERIDFGLSRSLDEQISAVESQISSAPQYISNDIFMQLFEDGILRPYNFYCTSNPELWEKCGNVTGVICLDNCKHYNRRKYYFTIGANALSPTYNILIWKWVCGK